MTSTQPNPAINPGVLVCVDLQAAFLAAMPDPDRLSRRCALAIAAAQGLGCPVLFTEQVPAKLGPTIPELLALAPTAPAFGKDAFSALGDATITAHLQTDGTKHLILCGLETPICIFQTALDALAAGHQVTLLSDCLGARRADDAATALTHLQKAGCHILPSESVFYALLGSARHPFFRPFTALVKKYN